MADVTTPWLYAEELLQVVRDAVASTNAGAIDRAHIDHEITSLDCSMIGVLLGPLTLRAAGVRGELSVAHAYKMGFLNLLGYKVLLARDCYPIGDDRGNPPTTAQRAEAMKKSAEDVWAVWNAIALAMEAGSLFSGPCSELFMDNATPLPVQGGVAGWTIALRAAVPGYTPGS